MTTGLQHQGALQLACPNFTDAEMDALRSLLGLLQPYLKQSWVISRNTDADLVLVNLDHSSAVGGHGNASVIGCAQRPRLHPAGTLHRPLRVAELLAVLTEVGERGHSTAPNNPRDPEIEWTYGLRAWPLDFQQWPRPAWRVLALITRARRSASEIAERSGLSRDEVDRHLGELQRDDLIDRFGVPRPPARVAAPATWRHLALRVGQLLGFR